MTTHEIRKNIFVLSWVYNANRLPYTFYIVYRFEGKGKTLILTKDDLISELIAISSIDNAAEFDQYAISQWDALCLAVRHELKEATDKEIEHLFKL